MLTLLAAMAFGVAAGAVPISPAQWWSLDPVQSAIVWELRAPRVVLGALVGGALAIAGASYQAVFRNPLADPYLLGAAAGAGLGATIVFAAAGPETMSLLLPIAAFVGALMGVSMSYGLGVAANSGGGTAPLLLAGIAVASFLTAIQTLVQQQNSDSLRLVYGWILGQLGRSDWPNVALVGPVIMLAALVLSACGRTLDVLSLGDDKAATLGVDVRRVRLFVVVMASLATALAVSVSGLIGFVGIIAPHVVRRLVGGANAVVLPVAFLVGGAFLVLADLLARTVVAPAELPIGVVTAFVGAPFFAALLAVRKNVV